MDIFWKTTRFPAWLTGRSASRSARSAALMALGMLFLTLPSADAFADPVQRNLIKRGNPEYPALAKRLRVQGAVVLRIFIDPAGRVTEARLASGSGLLAEAAKHAVKKWLYEAGPEPTRAFVRLIFSLA